MPCTLLSVELCTETARGRSLCCEPASEQPAEPTGPGELLLRPVAGEPSTAELCPCSDQLTLLGMETLTGHRHPQQVGNQLIRLNLHPSLSLVVFSDETLHFLQYSTISFCALCYLQQAEAGTPQAHFHSSCSSYSHNTAHTC